MPPSRQLEPTDPLTGVEPQASATSLREETNSDEPPIKRSSTSVVTYHYYWCYVLHGFLAILQIVLLVMLWSHPERRITVAFEDSVLTIGLSAFLQAFYTVCDIRGTKYCTLLTTFSVVYGIIGLRNPTTRPERFTFTPTETNYRPRCFWSLGWSWSCHCHVMATNENRSINQGNTFGLLVSIMYFRSTRGVAGHHGVSTIQCNIYNGRSIKYDMARLFCQPNHVQYGCNSTAGSPHVWLNGALDRRSDKQHAL